MAYVTEIFEKTKTIGQNRSVVAKDWESGRIVYCRGMRELCEIYLEICVYLCILDSNYRAHNFVRTHW